MSYLAAVNQPNGNLVAGKPQYYFAVDSSPDTPVVSAPAFTATGAGLPNDNGYISIAAQDMTGEGTDSVQLTAADGTIRWGIGTSGVEGGGNTGDDFQISNYSDDGEIIGTPLTINRATGVVSINGVPLSTQTAFTFAAPAIAPSKTIDLSAVAPSTVMTIPVPAAAQGAHIFKVRMSGGWRYSSQSQNPATLNIYCSSTLNAPSAASGDSNISYSNVLNPQQTVFGSPALYTFAGGGAGSALANTDSVEFLVQNPTGAPVANLYFIMTADPADGTQGIGEIITDAGRGLSAVVEAYV